MPQTGLRGQPKSRYASQTLRRGLLAISGFARVGMSLFVTYPGDVASPTVALVRDKRTFTTQKRAPARRRLLKLKNPESEHRGEPRTGERRSTARKTNPAVESIFVVQALMVHRRAPSTLAASDELPMNFHE